MWPWTGSSHGPKHTVPLSPPATNPRTASKIASEVDIYRSDQASIVDIIEEFGGTSFIANVFYHNFTKHFINYFDATI